jgi:Fe-S cluster assembly ATP-binding protein
MVKLLKRERTEHQTTTVVVSHNRAFLEAADIVLLVNQGRLAYVGNLKDALPMLTDLSICSYKECVSEDDVRCFR